VGEQPGGAIEVVVEVFCNGSLEVGQGGCGIA